MNITESKYISCARELGDICPVFRKQFSLQRDIQAATLEITALGVYVAELNETRVGDFSFAPGWTSFAKRLQVQSYDVTSLLKEKNELRVVVGRGWFRSPMPGWEETEDKRRRYTQPCGLIAALHLAYADGSSELIRSDESWQYGESAVRFSELYDGERYDARFTTESWQPVMLLDWPKEILIPQEGDPIRETEWIAAKRVIRTPAGETVVDFGQEITGYVEVGLSARSGDRVCFTHAETLDRNGNFYNENYRSAKAQAEYICRDGFQRWHPQLSFFGFRYIKLLEFPGEPKKEQFTAIAVHSDMKKTGHLVCGNKALNQLFSNIEWSQRDNFLDVPTDCPQRDERLGWTGDAQVFVKAASYLYDVERFFRKWLRDLAADQRADGEVGQVIPDVMPHAPSSAGWGDAATICPWQIYQTYGDKGVLAEQFDSMKAWVDYISRVTTTPNLWTEHFHFGDWLGLDSPAGSYKGSSSEELIATAYYYRSTELLVKAGQLLGRDVRDYSMKLACIKRAFRSSFPERLKQTEKVLALSFGLSENPQEEADALAAQIRADGTKLQTGFVGTPYLLHVLSEHGHGDLAWDLLLRREFPSWLYPVEKGATTMWEHWDGIREDGSFWSRDMNSFNHYAYGAVIDWVFEKAAGLGHEEDSPGFSRLRFAPQPDPRIGWLRAELDTRNGRVTSFWTWTGEAFRIELDTPVPTEVVLPSFVGTVGPGRYLFWEHEGDAEK